MNMTLVIIGLVMAISCSLMAGAFDSTAAILACVATAVIGFAIACFGFYRMSEDESDACHGRGGVMVEDGPPIYVMSGKVLVPVQSMKCEVSR